MKEISIFDKKADVSLSAYPKTVGKGYNFVLRLPVGIFYRDTFEEIESFILNGQNSWFTPIGDALYNIKTEMKAKLEAL